MTDAVSKGQAVFGKLPVDSMEIKTEREGKMYKRKSFFYILLDTLLLGILIAALIEESDANCGTTNCRQSTYPVVIYMMVCVFMSYVVDWRTWQQVNYGFINRRLVVLSLVLDLLIFAGGVWEIIVLIELKTNTETLIIAVLLIFMTFARVFNIVVMLMYIIFCLPLHCCPEESICYKWLDSDEIDI
jgi:hypothetical protein